MWIHVSYVYFVFLRERWLGTTRRIRSQVQEQPLAAQEQRSRAPVSSLGPGLNTGSAQGVGQHCLASPSWKTSVCLLMWMRLHPQLVLNEWLISFVCKIQMFTCASFCNHVLSFLHVCIHTRNSGRKNAGLASASELCPDVVQATRDPALHKTLLSLTLRQPSRFLSPPRAPPWTCHTSDFKDTWCDFYLNLMLSFLQPLPSTSKISQYMPVPPLLFLFVT